VQPYPTVCTVGEEARPPTEIPRHRILPVFRKIDCLQIPVPDLEAGLEFYRDQLGHTLIWRTDTAAGLRLPESDAEVVIQTERPELEVNVTVASADEAAAMIARIGGALSCSRSTFRSVGAPLSKIRGLTGSSCWIAAKARSSPMQPDESWSTPVASLEFRIARATLVSVQNRCRAGE
jgi:glyoxalase/bleomycin resistance protein/dioxygenase superfamily protein